MRCLPEGTSTDWGMSASLDISILLKSRTDSRRAAAFSGECPRPPMGPLSDPEHLSGGGHEIVRQPDEAPRLPDVVAECVRAHPRRVRHLGLAAAGPAAVRPRVMLSAEGSTAPTA